MKNPKIKTAQQPQTLNLASALRRDQEMKKLREQVKNLRDRLKTLPEDSSERLKTQADLDWIQAGNKLPRPTEETTQKKTSSKKRPFGNG